MLIQARRPTASGNGTLWTTTPAIHIVNQPLCPRARGVDGGEVTGAIPAPDAATDPAAVAYRLAGTVRMQADLARTAATRAALIAETLPWRSPASALFRARVLAQAVVARAAASRLDEAAQLLGRYAATVGAEVAVWDGR